MVVYQYKSDRNRVSCKKDPVHLNMTNICTGTIPGSKIQRQRTRSYRNGFLCWITVTKLIQRFRIQCEEIEFRKNKTLISQEEAFVHPIRRRKWNPGNKKLVRTSRSRTVQLTRSESFICITYNSFFRNDWFRKIPAE